MAIRIDIPMTGPVKVALAGLGVLGIIGFMSFLLFLTREKVPSPDLVRVQRIDAIVRVLELYYQRYGAYPQPTVRTESAGGVQHVWGYRAKKPALASCTVASGPDGKPSARKSACGGDVFDARENVIGWKGTLTKESALNSIETAERKGVRMSSPLSDLLVEIAMVDPTYEKYKELIASGFGEFVYAVSIPEDGATSRGGSQYQIAVTVRDPVTGQQRTSIRGNYFMRLEEEGIKPASLIGPGLLFDANGIAEPGQEKAIHVLTDSQLKGNPNTVLGQGEQILRTLDLRRKARKLLELTKQRREVLEKLTPPENDAVQSLLQIEEELGTTVTQLTIDPESPNADTLDLNAFDVIVGNNTLKLEEIIQRFFDERVTAVGENLRMGAERRDEITSILIGALATGRVIQQDVLLARDEVVRYLDGYGIEAQARNRAKRKLETSFGMLPDLFHTFSSGGLANPNPFLTSEVQEALSAMSSRGDSAPIIRRGSGTILSGSGLVTTETGSTGSGEELAPEIELLILSKPVITVSTVTADLIVFYADLKSILGDIEEDLGNPLLPMGEIDTSLRRLGKALGEELDRLDGTVQSVVPEEQMHEALAEFDALVSAGKGLEAVRAAATFSGLLGDYAPLTFRASSVDHLALDKEPGIPDVSSYATSEEAEYQGIPYPLP